MSSQAMDLSAYAKSSSSSSSSSTMAAAATTPTTMATTTIIFSFWLTELFFQNTSRWGWSHRGESKWWKQFIWLCECHRQTDRQTHRQTRQTDRQTKLPSSHNSEPCMACYKSVSSHNLLTKYKKQRQHSQVIQNMDASTVDWVTGRASSL